MITAVVSRLVILVFGTLYPAYASYKAVRTKNVREYVKWMMYWIVFALFSCAETFTDVFLSFWFPFYYEIKILLVLWLLSPATKGSSILYRKFVHPMLSRREQDIDEYIAKAKEQGYHTVLHLGTKGVNYATTVIMQTAIKGGGGLVQQLRRSYSLGDLSSDVDGDSSNGRKALPEAQDRNRDRERVNSDGRHHRPRGHSPRRSASGSGRVEMYFPEVDVDVRGTSVREPSVLLSHIRSSEDVSSGYSSAEPLYQQGGSVSGGQRGDSHHDSLASSREPLVRTASVGGSSRSGRTRSSRGGGGTTGKKGSAAGVPEASEESSLGGEDSPHMNSPSPHYPRSRSNSLPISPDLRPELIALLQALNAELEHGISMSKLAEMKTTPENTEITDGTVDLEQRGTVSASRESNSLVEVGEVSEKLQMSVSAASFSESSCINTSMGCDDIFYDSCCMSPVTVSNDCQVNNEDQDNPEFYSEPMTEPENVIVTPNKQLIRAESSLVPFFFPSSKMLPQTTDKCEAANSDDEVHGCIQKESTESLPDEKNDDQICTSESTERDESAFSPNVLPEIDLHKNGDDKLFTLDDKANASSEKISLQPQGQNSSLHVNCLDHARGKGQLTADEISHQEFKPLEILYTSDEYCNGTLSENILSQSNDQIIYSNGQMVTEEKQEGKILSSNDQIVIEEKMEGNIPSLNDETVLEEKQEGKVLSSNNHVVLEGKQEATSDNMQCTTYSTQDNVSENKPSNKQLSIPSVSGRPMENTQLIESIPVKEHEPNKNYDAKAILGITGSATDLQTSRNSVCMSSNLDTNQEPKKDIRSGRYHKLQAPEPPQRTRRSSSKSSTSDECESKSGDRSRSPKKAADSPVARLHDQIENLAAMLPFWSSGKRPRRKEDGGVEEGFRIREMSRSPSRRTGGQNPL